MADRPHEKGGGGGCDGIGGGWKGCGAGGRKPALAPGCKGGTEEGVVVVAIGAGVVIIGGADMCMWIHN